MHKMKAQSLVQLVRMADKIGITNEATPPTYENRFLRAAFENPTAGFRGLAIVSA
jgi:hypothetical protein